MTSSAAAHTVQIRPCSRVQEFQGCVRVQQRVWGDELAVPVPMIAAVNHAGGQVLGAFEGERMVGCSLAFLGRRLMPARSGSAQRVETPFFHSHFAAVLPEFRDGGVGRRLKLFQRQDALERGIGLIEWTFDPLELKNAYFNLVRLGVIVRRFIPDFYGITPSVLHAGMPTDRLLAEWWLASDRVKSIVEGHRPRHGSHTERISLPADISKRKSMDRDSALQIQSEIRAQFQKWFAKGYAATAVEKHGESLDYILEPADAIRGLHLPQLAAGERPYMKGAE
jgi:predicted GNAT superfamily acetyltransferase